MRILTALVAVVAVYLLAAGGRAQEAPAAGQLVSIEVLLADSAGPTAGGSDITAAKIVELDKQGKLDSASRIKLSLIENVPGSVQFGETSPLVSARQEFPGGGRGGMASYSMQNTGTTVQATARVEQDGQILVELTVERSRLVPAKPAADDAAPEPRRVSQNTTRTTVRVASGQSVLVGSQQLSAGKDGAQTYVVLTASVAGPAKAAAAPARPAAVIKIFTLANARATDVLKVIRDVLDDQPIVFAADERSNSIVAKGTEEQLETTRALIQRLDEAQ
jgi:type II secretory pathway component GspD/PulD (secretin)